MPFLDTRTDAGTSMRPLGNWGTDPSLRPLLKDLQRGDRPWRLHDQDLLPSGFAPADLDAVRRGWADRGCALANLFEQVYTLWEILPAMPLRCALGWVLADPLSTDVRHTLGVWGRFSVNYGWLYAASGMSVDEALALADPGSPESLRSALTLSRLRGATLPAGVELVFSGP